MRNLSRILTLTAVTGLTLLTAGQVVGPFAARLVTAEWKYTEPLVDTRNAHLQTAVKSVHTDIPAEVMDEETVAVTDRITSRSQVASLLSALKRLFGTPKDGQVLMGKNGTYSWQTLPTVTQPGSTVTPRPSAPARAGGGSARGGGGGAAQPAPLPQHSHEDGERGGQISIGSATTGVLAATRGGTGFDTYSAGDLLVGTNGSLERLGKGNQGEVLSVSGSSLVWKDADAAALTGNNARYVNVDGDTMSGALTILTPGDLGLDVVGTISGSALVINGASTFAGDITVKGTYAPVGATLSEGRLYLNNTTYGANFAIDATNGNTRTYFTSSHNKFEFAGSLLNLIATPSAADQVGFKVKGAASQTANLQEWQNSNGDTLLSIDAGGDIDGPSDSALSLSANSTLFNIGHAAGLAYLSGSMQIGGHVYVGNNLIIDSNQDAGLTRRASGVLQVTQGASGLGSLYAATLSGSALTVSSGLITLPSGFAIGAGSHGTYPSLAGTVIIGNGASNNNATGEANVIIGNGASVVSGGSVGSLNVVIGNGATAKDYRNIVIGDTATSTAGNGSIVIGHSSTTDATHSTTVGPSNTNNGSFSVALGFGNTTNGSWSMSLGYDVTTDADGMIGFGVGASNPDIRLMRLNGDNSATRNLASMKGTWIDSTDATRTSRLALGTYYTSTLQEGLRIDSASDQARLGIGGATVSGQRLTLHTGLAAEKGLVIKGAASQSANLQEWQDSNGTVIASIDKDGQIISDFQSNDLAWLMKKSGTTRITLMPYDAGGATRLKLDNAGGGFLQNPSGELIVSGTNVVIRDSSGSNQYVTMNGGTQRVGIGHGVVTPTGILDLRPSSAETGLVIKGAVSQSANLQEWQNSTGTTLASISAGGIVDIGPSGLRMNAYTIGAEGGTYGTIGLNTSLAFVFNRPIQTASIDSPGGGSGYRYELGPTSLSLYTGNSVRQYIDANGTTTFTPNAAAKGLIVKGAASQTASLQEWQDSDGNAIVKVNSGGTILSSVKSHVNNYAIKLAPSYNNGYENNQFDALLIDTANLNSHGFYSTGVASAIRVLDKYGGTAMRISPIGTTIFEPSSGYASEGVLVRPDASNDYYNDDYDFMRIRGDRINGMYGASYPHNMRFFRITGAGDAEVMTVSREGYTGLGTKTPETRLEVIGTMSGQALVVNGTSTFNGSANVGSNAPFSGAPRMSVLGYSDTQPLLVIGDGGGTTWKFNRTSGNQLWLDHGNMIIDANASRTVPAPGGTGFNLMVTGNRTDNGLAVLGAGSFQGIYSGPYTSYATPTAMIDTLSSSASKIGIIVKGATSQTANLQEWQESDGTALLSLTAGGILRFKDSADTTMVGLSVFTTNGLELNTGYPDGYTTTTLRLGNLLVANDGFVKFRDNNGNNVGVLGMDSANVLTLGNTSHVLKVSSPSTSFISSGGATLAKVDGTGQVQAGTGGLVTKVVSGACSDSSFTTDTNGTICVDSSNGRLYFRYGDAWHYTAQTAGFQIPNIERNGVLETAGLNVGDAVIGRIDERMEDGALHGIWEKFDLQGEITATLLAHPELLGSIGTGSGTLTETLTMEDIQDLAVQGSLVVYGNARFAGDVKIQGQLTLSGDQAGFATVAAGDRFVNVVFATPFDAEPVITATSDDFTPWKIRDRSANGFTIEIQYPAEFDISFSWLAVGTSARRTVAQEAPVIPSSESSSSASSVSVESDTSSESSSSASSEDNTPLQAELTEPVAEEASGPAAEEIPVVETAPVSEPVAEEVPAAQ